MVVVSKGEMKERFVLEGDRESFSWGRLPQVEQITKKDEF